MRAAIYARYSSDLQSMTSIDDQVRVCREYATRNGYSVVVVLADHAISGGSLSKRPEMLRLLDQASRGEFEVVLAESLDRLSRDQEDVASVYKRLSYRKIRIVTVGEGDINELHIGMKGTMNALYLKDLAAKTKRGQRGRVAAGKIPGGLTYGHRIVRKLQEDGTVTTGEREIDPEQAVVVRRIFQEYVSGLTARKIAARLNAEGIPSPRGKLWNASTINGNAERRNGILCNELYLGRILYDRQSFQVNPDTHKRGSRSNPEETWAIGEAPHLRIIDDETWEKVQKIKSRYASQRGNRRQSKKRLLSGLVSCGACGGGMTIINRERYYCSAKREKGTCSSSAGIKATVLEERVLTGLKDILVGADDLVATFVREFEAEVARLRKQRGTKERQLHKELANVDKAIARFMEFIAGGDGDVGLVREELKRQTARKRDLERQLAISDEAKAVEVHPNVAGLYRKKVAELQSMLTDDLSRPQATDIIRSMIEKIDIHESGRRGDPDIILRGALASILNYVHQNKTAASLEGGGRVLMVAGAGFEPATFRL